MAAIWSNKGSTCSNQASMVYLWRQCGQTKVQLAVTKQVWFTCGGNVVDQSLELWRDIRLLPPLVVQNEAEAENHNVFSLLHTYSTSVKKTVGISIYLLKAHNPVNRTGSPQGFSQVQSSHKLNTIQNMHIA